jgi:hypothetical protein
MKDLENSNVIIVGVIIVVIINYFGDLIYFDG